MGLADEQYLCLSCRCRAGCSCRARRSTCRSRGTPTPRSPHRPQRSCRVGSPSSSRIAGGKRGRLKAPPPHIPHPTSSLPTGLTRPVLSVHWKSCSTILSLSPIQVFSCPKPGEKGVKGGPRHRHPRGWGAPGGAAAQIHQSKSLLFTIFIWLVCCCCFFFFCFFSPPSGVRLLRINAINCFRVFIKCFPDAF